MQSETRACCSVAPKGVYQLQVQLQHRPAAKPFPTAAACAHRRVAVVVSEKCSLWRRIQEHTHGLCIFAQLSSQAQGSDAPDVERQRRCACSEQRCHSGGPPRRRRGMQRCAAVLASRLQGIRCSSQEQLDCFRGGLPTAGCRLVDGEEARVAARHHQRHPSVRRKEAHCG